MSNDAPDYERVVVLSASAMSDAPDWQQVITGPGGTPVGGGGGGFWDLPSDRDWLAWDFPFGLAQSVKGFSQEIWGGLTKCLSPSPVSNVVCWPAYGGADLVPGNNYVGIYALDITAGAITGFTLVASSLGGVADNYFRQATVQAVPLSAPFSPTVGDFYYTVLLADDNATGNASFHYTSIINDTLAGTLPFSVAEMPYAFQLTGPYSALPAAIAAGSIGLGGAQSVWVAWS